MNNRFNKLTLIFSKLVHPLRFVKYNRTTWQGEYLYNEQSQVCYHEGDDCHRVDEHVNPVVQTLAILHRTVEISSLSG